MERRVEDAPVRFTLERVEEAPERTVDEDLVPTTRRVAVLLPLPLLTCPEVVLVRLTVCPPFTEEERRDVEVETLFPA